MSGRKGGTPLSDRLAKFGTAAEAASVRVRDVERQHAAAEADVRRLSEARIEAFATGDDPVAGRLLEQRHEAEAVVADLAERMAGAERAVQRAQAERAEFITHNVDGLLGELAPAAAAAVRMVDDAIRALRDGHRAWQAVSGEASSLLQAAGRAQDRVPVFPAGLEDLVRDARRSSGVSVPLPLPRPAALATIVPHDDPDLGVRAAARAKMVRPADGSAADADAEVTAEVTG